MTLDQLAQSSGLVRVVMVQSVGKVPAGSAWWVSPDVAAALRAQGVAS